MYGFWREFSATWESVRFEIDEFIDAGEHVVTPFTGHLQGRDGIDVRARGVWVWTIRDGAVVRTRLFQEPSDALQAAGLRE